MNNDLISRSELKKALKSNCDTLCPDKNTNWCEHCCPLNDFEDLIDDAPTVEYPFYQEAYQTGYEEGYLKGVKVGNDQKRKICDGCKIYERPQGDLTDEVWKLYEKYQPYLATRVIEFGDELKDLLGEYQKGGADMRKGEEE